MRKPNRNPIFENIKHLCQQAKGDAKSFLPSFPSRIFLPLGIAGGVLGSAFVFACGGVRNGSTVTIAWLSTRLGFDLGRPKSIASEARKDPPSLNSSNCAKIDLRQFCLPHSGICPSICGWNGCQHIGYLMLML